MRRWLAVLPAALLLSHAAPAGGGATADGVSVFKSGAAEAKPCPAVDTSGRFVTGGCAAVAHAFEVGLVVRTVFGEMPFGNCNMTFDVTFAADGRIWLDNLRIGGLAPCNDVWPCAPDAVVKRARTPADTPPLHTMRPWAGRLLAGEGDRFSGRVNVCLDTCAGRYAGDLDVALVHSDDGWVLRAGRSGVGRTGLAFDGDLELDPAQFDPRPAS